MKKLILEATIVTMLISPSMTSAYLITTTINPPSSFEVLDETEFYSQYESPTLVTNLYDKGDNAQPDSWVVRGWYGGGGFYEDVSFGYERGLSSPYPIEKIDGYCLSIMAPDNLTNAVAIAVETELGFFGIVPITSEDKFYSLQTESGEYASTIYSINTVSVIPEPNTIATLMFGLVSLLATHRIRKRLKS